MSNAEFLLHALPIPIKPILPPAPVPHPQPKVTQANILGVILDPSLSFKPHIQLLGNLAIKIYL